MPFLTASRQFTCEKQIQAPYENVLKLIQDPYQLCGQNPLITSIVRDKDDPQLFIITDRLPVIGPFQSSTVYRAKIVPVDDGVTSETEAALNTRLRTRFSLERRTKNTCLLKELTHVEAPFFLMPYIFATMSKAHIAGLDNMAQRAMAVASL